MTAQYIHEEMKFKYLSIEISSFGNIEVDISVFTKLLFDTYPHAAVRRAETSKQAKIMETTEMKIKR